MSNRAKNQILLYGCTIDELRQVVEDSPEFRFRSPEMLADNILNDCQEILNQGITTSLDGNSCDLIVVEDVRQALNRVEWILKTYCRGI